MNVLIISLCINDIVVIIFKTDFKGFILFLMVF